MSIPIDIKEHFTGLQQDGVLWKANRLWQGAADADEQALAMEQISEMVCCISNEVKRLYYVDNIQKDNKIKNTLLKRQVRDMLQSREQKKQADIVKKKLEARYQNAEDAGLPNDFGGNIHDALRYGIYEHEGVYYTRGGARGGDYAVSNFTMKILYHVNTGDDAAYRLISVKNVYGFEKFINLNTDDFVSLGPFKKVLARNGDYIFKGADSDLSRLQEFLQKYEINAAHIKTLGWNKRGKFYAFANGIIASAPAPLLNGAGMQNYEFVPVDEYGMINYKEKNFFIPAVSKMYMEKDDMFVNEKKFIYRQPVDGFGMKEWADLFYKTYGTKSIAAILFYVGSLFRDIIMKQMQRYPLLCLFGPPGAGKGQLAESLMCMFGERQDQIMLGGASTVVGFMRKFAQFSNAIVWLDEYKNNLPFKFIESFKNIYDGKGYERGKMTNDFATESTPIHSSCILSGQDMPTIEPALFMRTILLSFEDGKFSEDQRQCFQQLKDVEASGLSYITAQLLQHREMVEQKFKEQFQLIQKQTIRDVANVEVDDRMILNIAFLLTFHWLFKDLLQFPFTYQEAKAFLIENMEVQHAILAGNNDVAKFWSVVETLFHQGIVNEDKDFMLEDGYIYLCLSKVYPWYVKELRQRGDMNVLAKPTLEHYLKLDKSVFVEFKKKRFADGTNNWVYKINYAKLPEQIDLIRVKRGDTESILHHDKKVADRYNEMKVKAPERNLVSDEHEELPFPVPKEN